MKIWVQDFFFFAGVAMLVQLRTDVPNGECIVFHVLEKGSMLVQPKSADTLVMLCSRL